jgi:hypothetical protein
MPNPMFLKVMEMELQEYNTLTPSEKEEFQNEARQRIADISNDPEAYTALTNTITEPGVRVARNFKRNKRNKEND